MLRRSLLAALPALLTSRAAVAEAVDVAPSPADDPAPFAASIAVHKFWPVVTRNRRWREVSARLTGGGYAGVELRCFNAPRPAAHADNPTRRHVGIDLFADPGDEVIAVEDGRLVGFYPFLGAATGEMTYALLTAHAGYVANYGEVRAASLTDRGLGIGDAVRGGQAIGEIGDTSQLHFETYVAGVTRNRSWRHGAARPSDVLDPTRLLLDLAANGERRLPP